MKDAIGMGCEGAQCLADRVEKSHGIETEADMVDEARDAPARRLPDIVAANEFRDVFGIALTNMLADGDPATELKKATEIFKPILERTEKG